VSPQELLDALARASSDLLYPSETDAPVTPYRWGAAAEPSPEALLRAEGRAPGTPVERAPAEGFFAGLAEDEEADRWAALAALLARELSDLRVYRVGRADIDAFLLGRHPSGVWLGVRTHLVET
jgi:hypothetical protein